MQDSEYSDKPLIEEELLGYLGECNFMLKDLLDAMYEKDLSEPLNQIFKSLKETNDWRMKIEKLLMNMKQKENLKNILIKTN